MTLSPVTFPNSEPTEVAPGVWIIQGTWKNKFARKMTILKLDDGSIAIHNPVVLCAAHLDWLKSTGVIKLIVAPNKYHTSDFLWMAKLFPQAILVGPQSKFMEWKKENVTLERSTAQEWDHSGLKFIPITGLNIEEVALFHTASKTLILCDLCFNMANVFSGFEKFIMDLNKVGGRFGPSRLAKWVFTRNRKSLLENVSALCALEPLQIIVGHGDTVKENCSATLQSSFLEIFE